MSAPLFMTRPPAPSLRGLIQRITGYVEVGTPVHSREVAALVFPVIFNLGTGWRIRLGSTPDYRAVGSFAAGLLPGPVAIRSDGGAACVQVDLTPKGAARLFGGLAADLGGNMVDLDLLPGFGPAARALIGRMAETPDWATRLDLAQDFIAARLIHRNAAQIEAAWGCLAQGLSITRTASTIGWSTRHLADRFRRETGLRPITAARMLRFHRAAGLALGARPAGWAMIAVEAGYADQAHLIRDFRSFTGESPSEWARHSVQPRPLLLQD